MFARTFALREEEAEPLRTWQHWGWPPGCSVAQSCPDSATPWTVARKAPLSMGFPRQEYWSGLAFPPPEDLPDPGIKPKSPVSPALADGFFTAEQPGSPEKPWTCVHVCKQGSVRMKAGCCRWPAVTWAAASQEKERLPCKFLYESTGFTENKELTGAWEFILQLSTLCSSLFILDGPTWSSHFHLPPTPTSILTTARACLFSL